MKNKKILHIALIILAVAVIATVVINSINRKRADGSPEQSAMSEQTSEVVQMPVSGDFTITNLDVGKGDAAVIACDGMTGIIDTGTNDAFSVIQDYLDAQDVKTLDFVIISHYDKDHVGGAVQLLENYDVKKIYLPDYVSEKKWYDKLLEALEERDDEVYVSESMTISMGDVSIELLPPTDAQSLLYKENDIDNNMSLMCMVTYGNNRFLFTGDVEKARIKQIINAGDDLKADWLKVPHHGGIEDNSRQFISLISPEYSVISTGDERPADDELVAILEELVKENYSTMEGSVVTKSDGTNISVSYLKE